MSLIDKQMLLRDLEQRLGEFVPGNLIPMITAQAGEAMAAYDVNALPDDRPDLDSEDLLDAFLNAKRVEGRADSTIERYRYQLTRLRDDTGVPFCKMTVHHIRAYFTSERERGISSGTLEGNRQCYNAFFGWLHRENLIEKNPMTNLTAIKTPKVKRLPFTDVEIQKLISAAGDSLRDLAIITFLASTGCRISEACGADEDDIDWQHSCLTVTGKGNKQRTVYLDDLSVWYLTDYLKSRTDNSPALFVGRASERMTPGGVRAMLKQLEKRSGVENVHPHRFRRTRATSLIDAGMPIQDVKTILGHDKLDTTMTYVYIDEKNVASSFRRYA